MKYTCIALIVSFVVSVSAELKVAKGLKLKKTKMLLLAKTNQNLTGVEGSVRPS